MNHSKGTDLLWQWTARELAKAIREKRISSREVVLSCLNRIEEVNPKLNALVEVSWEKVLVAADAADQAVIQGKRLGPLHGVPVSIKINTDQAGHATSDGVPAFRDNIPSIDSPQVANLKNAGAILVGRSNSPSFSLRWFTENDLHGKTFNPWDMSITPGGSSGGSAAAVASGMLPIAHANDIGGSIRYPAYACGITGIRPTLGRVAGWAGPANQDQSLLLQMMWTEGLLARSVGDLRLGLSSLSEFDVRDPIYTPAPLTGKHLKRPIHVGLVKSGGIVEPDEEINKVLDDAAHKLSVAGYVVEEVDLPLFYEAFKLFYQLTKENIKLHVPLMEQMGDKKGIISVRFQHAILDDVWEAFLGHSSHMECYARRGTLIAQLQEFLQDYPLLLLPVSAELPFEQDEDTVSIERLEQMLKAQWPMTSIPVLGFPAISVPTSVVNGIPVGVQILGRRFREDTLFDIAEVLENLSEITTPIDPM